MPCTAMCQWVHAMFSYYNVNLTVAPLRASLVEAEAELAVVSESLKVTRKGLKEVPTPSLPTPAPKPTTSAQMREFLLFKQKKLVQPWELIIFSGCR